MASRKILASREVERFGSFITRWLGFELDDEKIWSLSDLLRDRLEKADCTADAYLSGLEGAQPGSGELRALAQALTVNETSFFRNPDQMAAFAEVALPQAIAARAQARTLRILSAGCASGEEAYSLAMIIHTMPMAAGYDIAITGIDADTMVLGKAAAARYSAWSLRQTPPAYRNGFFRPERREFVLADPIRRMVRFEERNLVLDDPSFWQEGAFDIVFCRNVIMYFTQAVARAVIARIAGSMAPGGFLFLGLAETLRGLSDDFQLHNTHGTFYYRRRAGAMTAPCKPLPQAVCAPPADGAGDADFVETIKDAAGRIASLRQARPQPGAMGRKTAARAPFDLAPVIELFQCDRVADAMDCLNGLPAEAAHDPQVLLLNAILLTHGGNLAEAETVCSALLAQDGRNAGAHYLTALCRESAGDLAGAARHDRYAAQLDPEFAMPHLHLGVLARRAGDWDAARRELEKAASLIEREDSARLVLFGGGFRRDALSGLCRAQMAACGGRA